MLNLTRAQLRLIGRRAWLRKSNAKAQTESPVKRSRALQEVGQAVKTEFRRSRILTPVANGPTRTIGVTPLACVCVCLSVCLSVCLFPL